MIRSDKEVGNVFQPKPLSVIHLDEETLRIDKKNCKKNGSCGVGEKALYLGGFLVDRAYYIPLKAISRVYKQVAMSKGGFTGKGMFGSIPYLVVEYDGGQSRRCKLKWEEDVDRILERVHDFCPDIPLRSVAAQKKIDEEIAAMKARLKDHISEEAQRSVEELDHASAFLECHPDTYRELMRASKAKRSNDIANPYYKWAALAIMLMALVAALFGGYVMWTGVGEFGLYFLLFGIAFIMLFSSANVLPTKRNNAQAILERLLAARRAMEAVLTDYKSVSGKREFPLPARYAHPLGLRRMKREIQEGRAETVQQALDVMKADLKAINSSVTVYQCEYEEIVAIKPMFLIENYQ